MASTAACKQRESPYDLFWTARVQGVCALAVMCLAVLAVHCPPSLLSGTQTLIGADFGQIHEHRIRYAQDALFGAQPHLPGWYSRELLGTPFWSNVQSFPFIPTRLVLLLCDSFLVFPIGINLAAVLAAVFTYLYARRIGLSVIPAAAAGWTFACSGFFASRVMVGHLPLLEVYPSLPLLLWLIERCLQAPRQDRRMRLLVLGLAGTCTILAGHPQLAIYTLASCFLYLLYRGRDRASLEAGTALTLGLGMAAFALFPMLKLIGRSTRVLNLDAPGNNIYFPYRRLHTFLFPWRDGWDPMVQREAGTFFREYTNSAFFWDTICYVGWLPVLAVVFCLVRLLYLRKPPARPWLFIALLGAVALLTALPFMQTVLAGIPGTLLRSPARQLYLTTFALALALGAALEAVTLVARGRRWVWGVVVLGLAVHLADLGSHSTCFIAAAPIPPRAERKVDPGFRAAVGDGRIAVDSNLGLPWDRELDDAGFFDSIMLARPYAAMLAIGGAPPRLNIQQLDAGHTLNASGLAYLGVKLVVTTEQRDDLSSLTKEGPVSLYAVPDAQPRAQFLPQRAARFLDEAAILDFLRQDEIDLRQTILLPALAAGSPTPARSLPAGPLQASVAYQRESSDAITVKLSTDQPGYVRILEAWDPGWRAWIDGRPAELLPAESFVMALPVEAGTHTLHLRYSTPGAGVGAAIALSSLAALLTLAWFSRRRGEPAETTRCTE